MTAKAEETRTGAGERASEANPMKRVMGLWDFRALFVGTATSLLGDQFALIATPWLVLVLTGDPLALGIVLALEGLPRALFMLVGGAVTDRFSPRRVMFLSDAVRFMLTVAMSVVVFGGSVEMWMLYTFALAFGLVAGFAVPAQNSIVPMIVEERDLQAGNSIIMGATQLVGFVGPTVAGVLIGAWSGSYFGVGLAFAVDALTFAASALCLWHIRKGCRLQPATDDKEKDGVGRAIASGFRFLWSDDAMRLMFLLIMAVNFLLVGPLLVGIPVLADQRLTHGAVAFGLLMSAFSGGNLAGYLIAGSRPLPGGAAMRVIIVAVLTAFGAVIAVLGLIPSVWIDFVLLLLLGVGNGYVGIILFTWLQTRTPKPLLGRIMSMLMFASAGLLPVSQAISGAVIKWDLDVLFACAGTLAVAATLLAAFRPGMKALGESMASGPPPAS